MFPEPEAVGSWLNGAMFSVMVAGSERLAGVAPSFTLTAKLSAVFWSAPMPVCT